MVVLLFLAMVTRAVRSSPLTPDLIPPIFKRTAPLHQERSRYDERLARLRKQNEELVNEVAAIHFLTCVHFPLLDPDLASNNVSRRRRFVASSARRSR